MMAHKPESAVGDGQAITGVVPLISSTSLAGQVASEVGNSAEWWNAMRTSNSAYSIGSIRLAKG